MPQRLRHPQPGLPDNFQQQDDQQHFCKQGQRRSLFGSFDLIQQLGRDQLRQIDRQTNERPRQKDREVKGSIVQHPQEGGEHSSGRVVVQAFKVFAEKCRQHHGRRAAVDQHYNAALAQFGRSRRRALGVADRSEQPCPAGQKPRYKIAAVQQQLRLCSGKGLPHLSHHGRVCPAPAVANSVLCPCGGVGLRHLQHQIIGTDQTTQQTQVHPQQVGKALPRAAQVALSFRLVHRAVLEGLHRKSNAFRAAIQ